MVKAVHLQNQDQEIEKLEELQLEKVLLHHQTRAREGLGHLHLPLDQILERKGLLPGDRIEGQETKHLRITEVLEAIEAAANHPMKKMGFL